MSEVVAPQFEAPRRVEDAVALLAKHGPAARVLAGGTDLLAQMKSGTRRPAVIVDLKRIDELMQVREAGGGLVIGAAAPAAVVREHAALRRLFPGLAEAAALIGSEQIQGRASLGGNLCNASPAADTTPALLVNDASVEIAGPSGRRKVPVAAVCTAPGRTSLAPGELLLSIVLAAPAPRSADAYLRLIPRTEMDIAVVGAAVRVALAADGSCSAACVALGAVAPTAIRVPEAEAALVGTRLDAAALARMVEAVRAAAKPIGDKRGTVAYRRQVIGVLARRAAERAFERARVSQAGPQAPRSGTRSEP
jgi:aerobic carbon-monoxide dehydrogenase medium subunit